VRRQTAVVTLVAGVLLAGVGATPSGAVSAEHDRVVSADPADFTPNIQDGRVLAVARLGGEVVVGGNFTRVRHPLSSKVRPRVSIFAFDAKTGKIDKHFIPKVDGVVETIARSPNGKSVYIGGSFNHVNGTRQLGLAKISLATGEITGKFSARVSGRVNKILIRGDRLIAAGGFTTANGAKRDKLAIFSARTGKLDDFNLPVTESRFVEGTPMVKEMDATRDGSKLVIIGNFRRVNGLYRNQIAMIDLESETVSPWSTLRFSDEKNHNLTYYTYMRDVEFSRDGSYFVVVTTGGCHRNGTLRDSATRWDTYPLTANRRETWVNYTGGDSLYSVAVTGAAVYVGGHQRWMSNPQGCNDAGSGAIAREGIAALRPADGSVLPWNPGRARGVGVEELVGVRGGLYLGSDTTRLAWEHHARIGYFPLP